jgi:hypothetical protein
VPPELLPLKWLFNWLWDWLTGWLLLNWLWEWWTVERVIALATAGQLVVLVAAALYARAQVREARELREDQARPFVVVDFDVREGYLVYLVVANLGKTMARNVRIDVHPPFECSFDSMVPVPMAKLKLFTEPIPSLAPGKWIEFVFDTLRRRGKELPSVYRVTLRYEGERGPLPPDELTLDLDLYRNMTMVRRDTIHNVSETLTKLLRRFEQWSAGPEGGLLVLSPEDKRRRNEEFRAWVEEEQAAEQTTDNGQPGGSDRARLVDRLVVVLGRLGRRR